MIRLLVRRLLTGLATVFFIVTATFLAVHWVPGDPLLQDKGQAPEVRAQLIHEYGLDQPLGVQYGVYLRKLARGDFGISFTQQNRSVNDIIREHFPVSATLGLLALALATLGGILLGSISALRRGRAADQATRLAVILGISVPSFVFAAILQYGVSELNQRAGMTVLPVGGWGTAAHLLLPSLVLGLGTLAFLTRLMRSSLLEVITQDHVRTARAKGLSERQVFWSHQLRNALLPVITTLGPAVAALTTGGFVVESVFAIPGLGRYFVQAVQQLDYTVILGLTVFYGTFLVLMVVAIDLVYAWVDPRIRWEHHG